MKKIITKSQRWLPSSKLATRFLVAVQLTLLFSLCASAQRQMENINRGLLAIRTSTTQVYVGWRLFGTDPSTVGFNVYRGTTKLNATPITASTNYVDNISTNETYTIRPVLSGIEQTASEAASVSTTKYLRVPIQQPTGGTTPDGLSYTYHANDCSVADLDGDGTYDYVVKWDPSNYKDNAQLGYTGNVYLDGYKMDGTRLFRIDLGKNIRAGSHYNPFMVYDLDGDGKAELACKTADGTVDGVGAVIGSASADYRTTDGLILTGPEYFTVFNGQTGAAMATADYYPARGDVNNWGDNYGNRSERYLATIAYLDGTRPSVVMARGYYTRLVRTAWDWRNGQLTQRSVFDSNTAGNGSYAGQGNHQLSVGDVNGDGKQEVINGSSATMDGTGLWSNGMGHGDALHMSDMDPNRAGQEIWMPYEYPAGNGGVGMALLNAATGAPLFTVPATGDIGRGVAADIDSRYDGYELWGATGSLYTCTGTNIGTKPVQMNHAIWWDADLQRELMDGPQVDKWNTATATTSTIATLWNLISVGVNNSTKKNPCLTADVLGDWREEAILRASDQSALIIFPTTTPATNRIYTLMHDTQYRCQVSSQNSGYNQPPHPSFYLGGGMSTPPIPNIYLAGATPSAPEAPTGLGATPGDSQVSLSWTASSGATSYNVKRAAVSGGPYTAVATGVTATSYNNTGLINGTTYYYVVSAVNTVGESANSNEASATPEAPAPATPTNLTATAGDAKADLSWTASSGATSYNVKRSTTTGGPYSTIATGVSTTTYSNTGLTNGTTYYFVVSAVNSLGESANSNQASATPAGTSGGLIIQENTIGFCSVQGTVDNNNAGFTGTGFANPDNAKNRGVTWRINVPATGTYTLTWRHANGSGSNRPGRLYVNGTQVVSTINFPVTANWTTWTGVSISRSLTAGTNSIRLESTTNGGLSNIDYLEVTGNAPTVLNCLGAIMAVNDGPLMLEDLNNKAEGDQVSVYPNPSSADFNLSAAGKFTYRIFDQLGKEVEAGEGKNNVKAGAKLLLGVYFINIQSNGKVKIVKVIKQ